MKLRVAGSFHSPVIESFATHATLMHVALTAAEHFVARWIDDTLITVLLEFQFAIGSFEETIFSLVALFSNVATSESPASGIENVVRSPAGVQLFVQGSVRFVEA